MAVIVNVGAAALPPPMREPTGTCESSRNMTYASNRDCRTAHTAQACQSKRMCVGRGLRVWASVSALHTPAGLTAMLGRAKEQERHGPCCCGNLCSSRHLSACVHVSVFCMHAGVRVCLPLAECAWRTVRKEVIWDVVLCSLQSVSRSNNLCIKQRYFSGWGGRWS